MKERKDRKKKNNERKCINKNVLKNSLKKCVSLNKGRTAGQSNHTREENTQESVLLQRGQEPNGRRGRR